MVHVLTHSKSQLEIQILPWDRHNNVMELNRLMGSQPSPLDNWISNVNTYINKQ